MLNEACFALGEGVATIPDIDAACQLGLNHPMGPLLALADFIGLDTCLSIMRVLFEGTGDPKFRAAPLLVRNMWKPAGWGRRRAADSTTIRAQSRSRRVDLAALMHHMQSD